MTTEAGRLKCFAFLGIPTNCGFAACGASGDYQNCLILNAIDGSIIDPQKGY